MLDCVPCKDFYILTLPEFLRSDKEPRIRLELNELPSLELLKIVDFWFDPYLLITLKKSKE
jgi:hypothetical protein